MKPNPVVKHLLVEIVCKARMIEDHLELDDLIENSTGKIFRAVHAQDTLLTEKDVVARYTFLTLPALRNMRMRQQGPKYVKFGHTKNSRVYYRRADIEQWIVDHYQLTQFIDEKCKISN